MLVRIGHIDVLPQLFGGVLIPPAVASELSHGNTPREVKTWLAAAPPWLEVRAPAQIHPTLDIDDPCEVEAISLAMETKADLLLADDKKARKAAKERGIATTGAVGVLELAAARNLLDLSSALARLRGTNFSVSEHILDAALTRDARRKGTPP
ncbi:MAG: DUF3368 domain-containing protein [Phycisphaerales bacterium]|nr:MAG: DUF3368 domain-containing protein [Phycisphaerales bacterium]